MRRILLLVGAVIGVSAAVAVPAAPAQAVCPGPNPVANENGCNTGATDWRVSGYSTNVGGFPTQTSVDLGQSVTLKIGRGTFPLGSANIAVYRMGYYGGRGARLVNSATNVAINNSFACNPMDPTTGRVSCANWQPTYTVPGSAFPQSGVYLAKVTAGTEQTHIVFTVRDDSRPADVLFVLPIADYTAYNTFGGKSLYWGSVGGDTVAGTDRAVKVSFDRPLSTVGREKDWLFGPDQNTLYWLEQQGYDVAYSDDVDVHRSPSKLLQYNAIVVPGHSEYWSAEQYHGFKAARDAGVNIASFSANTSYWKVRYEDGERTLVCYKTVEGGGSGGSGAISANDWGPDGVKGTADDALGMDGVAGTADDRPDSSTTTWRDNGAPAGDANAPPGGRVGPNEPENSLWGVMYVGDNDSIDFPLTVPAGTADGEFAADRIWRNAGLAASGSTSLGTEIVGWEWDAVPTQPQYRAFQPAGVVRLSATNVQVQSTNSWLQDEGRARATTPPPGQPGTVNAVKYRASSGAIVFAGGTNQWGLGLADDASKAIQQATYNLFSDMGIGPATPTGIVQDPGGANRVPLARFGVSPNPANVGQTVTFDGSTSGDAGGAVVRWEWDLDGDGSFETDAGGSPLATRAFGAAGTYTVRLRVTDNGGATDRAAATATVTGPTAPPGGGGGAPGGGASPGGGGAPKGGGSSGGGGGSGGEQPKRQSGGDRSDDGASGEAPAGGGVATGGSRSTRRWVSARIAKDLRRLRLSRRADLASRGFTLRGVRPPAAGMVKAAIVGRRVVRRGKLTPPRTESPIAVAAARMRYSEPNRRSIPLALTRAGRRELSRAGRIRLTLRLSFVDLDGVETRGPRGQTIAVD